MTPWILLFLTLVSAYLTYDAFRWRTAVERGPFSTIASLWKGGLSHLPATKQAEVQQYYSSRLGSQICWVFLITTVTLVVATVRAFVSQSR
jgi:hypothetical protein